MARPKAILLNSLSVIRTHLKSEKSHQPSVAGTGGDAAKSQLIKKMNKKNSLCVAPNPDSPEFTEGSGLWALCKKLLR